MLLTNRLPATFDPWRVMRAIEQQWNESLGEWLDTASQFFAPGAFRLWTREGTAIVEFDLPGCSPDGIHVSVLRDVLTVDVTSEEPQLPEGAEYHLRERVPQLKHEVRLPFAVDPQRTEASYVNGVLRVTLYQPESDRPARIEVKAS